MFIYVWERERARVEGAERGRQIPKQGLHADSSEPNEGLGLANREIMTWAEVRCLTDWATQVPLIIFKEELFKLESQYTKEHKQCKTHA